MGRGKRRSSMSIILILALSFFKKLPFLFTFFPPLILELLGLFQASWILEDPQESFQAEGSW